MPFIVHLNYGFYAERQPHFQWSLTTVPEKARQYKSVEGATKLCERARKYGSDFLWHGAVRKNLGQDKLTPVIYKIKRYAEGEGFLLEPVGEKYIQPRTQRIVAQNALSPEFLEKLFKEE